MKQHEKKTFRDPTPVPDETICKKGQGEKTCSFLGVEPLAHGARLVCLKGSGFESNILKRRSEGSMCAKGDNCSGPPSFAVV